MITYGAIFNPSRCNCLSTVAYSLSQWIGIYIRSFAHSEASVKQVDECVIGTNKFSQITITIMQSKNKLFHRVIIAILCQNFKSRTELYLTNTPSLREIRAHERKRCQRLVSYKAYFSGEPRLASH